MDTPWGLFIGLACFIAPLLAIAYLVETHRASHRKDDVTTMENRP